ncbi:MAG: EAL domain-containing protein [Halomonas sp.]|nr:EAL domain-containing protein [Halomonas sp.]
MTNLHESHEGIDIEVYLTGKGGLYEKEDIDAHLQEILQDAIFAVRKYLGMNLGFISEFSNGRRTFKVVDSSNEDPIIKVGDSAPLEESYCQHVVDGRFPNLINDALMFNPALDLKATEMSPVRAHASVPIRFSNGVIYGTFCCFSTEAGKALNEKDLAIMNVFSEFAGRHIERARNHYRRSFEVSEKIRSIIDNGEMHPVYQPIFHVRENRIIGYESLTRFDVEPYRPPNLWFEAAKAVGLQVELEIVAIRAALKNMDQIPEDCYLAVNVSPATVMDPSFSDSVNNYPLDRVVLEVTEHASVPDYDLFKNQLGKLRSLGAHLAIDDVGAGYSSLRHILELSPDIIKLDRSLITQIDKRSDRRFMAGALIGFANDMNIKIVAEGIETIEELNLLNELGVRKAQGYLLGRPLPIEEIQIQKI